MFFQIDCECKELDSMYSDEPEIQHWIYEINTIANQIQGLLVYQGLLFGIQIIEKDMIKNCFIGDIISENSSIYDAYGYGSLLGIHREYLTDWSESPFVDKDK